MKRAVRFLLVPLFVVVVLAAVLLNGLIEELRLGLHLRRQRLIRRYFALIFLPLCQFTELFVRLLQN